MTNAFTRGLRRSLIVAGACLALATPASPTLAVETPAAARDYRFDATDACHRRSVNEVVGKIRPAVGWTA